MRPCVFMCGWHIWHWELIFCVCVCVCVCCRRDMYLCISVCMCLHDMYSCLCVLVLSDVCVTVPKRAPPLKLCARRTCVHIHSKCAFGIFFFFFFERRRRFCSSDTATVSCRHIQSRRNHYTMFSVIN